MSVPGIETAAVGWPVTRLGVSFFPLYLACQRPPLDPHRPGVGARGRGTREGEGERAPRAESG